MDWTNFGAPSFHHFRTDVDVRHEIIRSIIATAVFFTVLSLGAITIGVRISHGVADTNIETITDHRAPL